MNWKVKSHFVLAYAAIISIIIMSNSTSSIDALFLLEIVNSVPSSMIKCCFMVSHHLCILVCVKHNMVQSERRTIINIKRLHIKSPHWKPLAHSICDPCSFNGMIDLGNSWLIINKMRAKKCIFETRNLHKRKTFQLINTYKDLFQESLLSKIWKKHNVGLSINEVP